MTSMIRQDCDRGLIKLYRIRLIVYGAAASALPTAALAAAGKIAAVAAGLFFVLSGTATALAAVYLPRLWFDRLHYIRHTDWLMIERGLLRRRTVLVPRSRLQLISLRRSFLEKRLGLCTVELSAGGETIRLEGLSPDAAIRMKSLLERRERNKAG